MTDVTDGSDRRATVDAAAQQAFAGLSGDHNPLHVDPLAARRLPFGRCAVHGVHLALLAIDAYAADHGTAPARIRATFRRPVGVGDEITLGTADGAVRLTVDGQPAADVRIDAGDTPARERAVFPPLAAVAPPAELGLLDLAGRSGTVPIAGDGDAMARWFTGLDPRLTADLLAVTRLVGMHVPGLHSMLAALDLTVRPEPGPAAELAYTVETVDDRFSKVVLRVDGAVVHGTVTAFVRPAPADLAVVTAAVAPGEFAGGRALVIGGSRGLGAAAVQLLAAGGADVRFTYHRGADEAARVQALAPGSSAHRLDVAGAVREVARDVAAIVADGWQPTLLAWFASPPIFVGARGAYLPELFDRFRTVYVDAFLAAAAALAPGSLHAILWPSSEAVEHDVPGLAEYADAKRAGEAAVAALAAAQPGLRVDVTRFPRLRTDQTASFVPVDADDPAPHVLAALRRLVAR